MSAADDEEFWSDSVENVERAPPPSGVKPGLWEAAMDRQTQNPSSSFSGGAPWLMTPQPSNKSAADASSREQGLPSSLQRARANSASFFKSIQHEFPTRSLVREDFSSIPSTPNHEDLPATCFTLVENSTGGWGDSLWDLSADLSRRSDRLPSPGPGGAGTGASPPGWGVVHGKRPPAPSASAARPASQGLPGGGVGAPPGAQWRGTGIEQGANLPASPHDFTRARHDANRMARMERSVHDWQSQGESSANAAVKMEGKLLLSEQETWHCQERLAQERAVHQKLKSDLEARLEGQVQGGSPAGAGETEERDRGWIPAEETRVFKDVIALRTEELHVTRSRLDSYQAELGQAAHLLVEDHSRIQTMHRASLQAFIERDDALKRAGDARRVIEELASEAWDAARMASDMEEQAGVVHGLLSRCLEQACLGAAREGHLRGEVARLLADAAARKRVADKEARDMVEAVHSRDFAGRMQGQMAESDLHQARRAVRMGQGSYVELERAMEKCFSPGARNPRYTGDATLDATGSNSHVTGGNGSGVGGGGWSGAVEQRTIVAELERTRRLTGMAGVTPGEETSSSTGFLLSIILQMQTALESGWKAIEERDRTLDALSSVADQGASHLSEAAKTQGGLECALLSRDQAIETLRALLSEKEGQAASEAVHTAERARMLQDSVRELQRSLDHAHHQARVYQQEAVQATAELQAVRYVVSSRAATNNASPSPTSRQRPLSPSPRAPSPAPSIPGAEGHATARWWGGGGGGAPAHNSPPPLSPPPGHEHGHVGAVPASGAARAGTPSRGMPLHDAFRPSSPSPGASSRPPPHTYTPPSASPHRQWGAGYPQDTHPPQRQPSPRVPTPRAASPRASPYQPALPPAHRPPPAAQQHPSPAPAAHPGPSPRTLQHPPAGGPQQPAQRAMSPPPPPGRQSGAPGVGGQQAGSPQGVSRPPRGGGELPWGGEGAGNSSAVSSPGRRRSITTPRFTSPVSGEA